MSKRILYEWSHVAHGVLASNVTMEQLLETIRESSYIKPDFARLQQGLHLTGEYQYMKGIFTVKKIEDGTRTG